MTNPLGAYLHIDLDALADNYRTLQARVGGQCRVAGVVKANAYGVGVEPVARVLRTCEVDFFFVATIDEGCALRALFLDAAVRIAVLGGLLPGTAAEFSAHHLIPVLNDLAQVNAWRAHCSNIGRDDPCVLHVDTGMNRLGLGHEERAAVVRDPSLLAGINLVLVMSHFACADEPENPMTAAQWNMFDEFTRRVCPNVARSMANSAGVYADSAYHADMVRPGMAIYGLNPTPGRPNPMRNVVGLRAPVLQIRTVPAGDTIGYGATFCADAPMRVATLGIGYADGFLRALSNHGHVYVNGAACPVLGRVSMDAVVVDVSAQSSLTVGDFVDVLGPEQGADALANAAGTIGYEILTALGARYARTYHGGI